MSKKSAKIAALIEGCGGQDLDAHYLGYFERFNQGLFYEAHDVLEELWLAERGRANHAFYQGLIQFAGAFVHLRKHSERHERLRPAGALFKLARTNLAPYGPQHLRLDVAALLGLIEFWLGELERRGYAANPLEEKDAPRLCLET